MTWDDLIIIRIHKSSHPEVFLDKDVLKICRKFTGEHRIQSVISIKLQSNCYPVNLLRIFRMPFLKNTSRRLLLNTWNLKFSIKNHSQATMPTCLVHHICSNGFSIRVSYRVFFTFAWKAKSFVIVFLLLISSTTFPE